MEERDLNFIIEIESELKFEEIDDYIRTWEGIKKDICMYKMSGFHLYFIENEYYDEELKEDPDNGFLYYPYRLIVEIIDIDPTLNECLIFARELKKRLEKINCKVTLVGLTEEF